MFRSCSISLSSAALGSPCQEIPQSIITKETEQSGSTAKVTRIAAAVSISSPNRAWRVCQQICSWEKQTKISVYIQMYLQATITPSGGARTRRCFIPAGALDEYRFISYLSRAVSEMNSADSVLVEGVSCRLAPWMNTGLFLISLVLSRK